jgi:transposase-like protein
MIDKALKESIIAEYLLAGLSYRQIADKRGVDYRSLHRWVKQHQGRMKTTSKVKSVKPIPDLSPQEPLPTDVKLLQAELRKARLYTEVLQEALKIAEEELGLPIRKKSGTKQS